MSQILVTGYVNPDLDAIACAVAYVEFLQKTGTDAVAGIIGEPQEEARFICNRFDINYPQCIQNVDDYSQVILVDTSELAGLEGKVPPEKVIEIIDHRKIHEADKFPNARVQIELVGSASTLIAEKFIEQDIAISKESAILLCGAILSNTFNFKGGVTTQRDKDAYEWLNRFAGLPEDFWRELFIAKSDMSGDRLQERMRDDFAWFVFGNKKFGIAQLEMMGARKLIDERRDEIVEVLKKIQSEINLDFIFQNTVALDEEKNFFIADDLWTQHLLEKVLDVEFQGVVAERPNLIMRKQIIPLLKEELERI